MSTTMTDQEASFLLRAIYREKARRGKGMLASMYPDEGPLRRELYQKHQAFFAAGSHTRWRLALGANRVGKSVGIGGYEMATHLTGLYPEWWRGVRFDGPVRAWAVGKSAQTTRDIVQEALMGPPSSIGTGLIPKHLIIGTARKAGAVPDALEYARVKRKDGSIGTVYFKSYDQQRKSFEGVYQHVIWLDEECPADIHSECSMRIMPTGAFGGGTLLNTFTPLQGLSELVLQYCPGGEIPDRMVPGEKQVVLISWDDVPHLSEESKAEFLAQIPQYQKDARTKGLPILGSGAIYPVSEDDYLIDPFEIPPYWRRAYGVDVGWNCTAGVFGAYNIETDTWYLYHEYKRGEAEPAVHVEGIRAPGVPRGVIDPASRGRGQADGRQLLEMYNSLGLDLSVADNGVETGIYAVWQRLSSGKLKVFRTMGRWREECRQYHRDEKGRVVKANDHLMDATRYLIMSGQVVATNQVEQESDNWHATEGSSSWMSG